MPESDDVELSNDVSEETYEVGGIISHMRAIDLINKILKGEKYSYYPESISNREHFHSEYAYLVHWNNFPSYEDTWEPEGSLEHLQLLVDYKKSSNIPLNATKTFIFRIFSEEVVEKLKLRGIRHQEEVLKIKAKGANQNSSEEEKKNMKSQPTPQMHQNNKHKALHLVNTESSDSRDSSPVRTSVSTSASSVHGSEPQRKKKKKRDRSENRKEENRPKVSFHSQTLPNFRIPKKSDKIEKATEENGNNRKDDDMAEVMQAINDIEMESDARIEVDLNTNRILKSQKENQPSSMSTRPEDRSQTESPESKEIKKTKKVIKTAVLKVPKMKIHVKEPLPFRSFETALEITKSKQSKSLESLCNKSELRNAEFQLYNMKEFHMNKWNRYDEVTVEKTLSSEFQLLKRESEAEKIKEDNILLLKNQESVWKDFENHVKGGNSRSLLNELVRCYTFDYFDDFEDVFSCIPEDNEIFRFMIVQSIILRCKTVSTRKAEKSWTRRNKRSNKGFDLRFVETDLDVNFEDQPVNYEKCSENHVKCLWLKIFLQLTPISFRFIVKSGRNLGQVSNRYENDEMKKEEDGPFRDDVFLHCLKYGADCQKWALLEHDAPFGFLEDDHNDKIIDHVHIVITQGMNLLKIQKYIQQGFDVNAFAKVGKKGKLQNLCEYVREWVEDVSKTKHGKNLDLNYFKCLEDMINNISNCVSDFMIQDIYKTLVQRSDGLIRPQSELTPPHILHCSPVSNLENGGPGEHQVLTCLFQPQGCLLAGGLREKGRREAETNCQESMDRMRKLIKEGKGRMMLVVLRVEINTYLPNESMKAPPVVRFQVVEKDEGFKINTMTLLRQGENLSAEIADIGMVEMAELATPGRRYFVLHNVRHETELVVPGMAHIEMQGSVDKAMNFLVQLYFVQTEKD